MSNAWILWIKVNTGIIICVTAPIPEQEGGAANGSISVFLCRRYGWRCMPLRHQVVGRR